jgi:hypothetical protein
VEEPEGDTYSQENDDDNDNEDNPQACCPPPCLSLVLMSCSEFLCCARSVDRDRGDVVLNVIYDIGAWLAKKAKSQVDYEPSISPCSWTIVPKSLKISCNS